MGVVVVDGGGEMKKPKQRPREEGEEEDGRICC